MTIRESMIAAVKAKLNQSFSSSSESEVSSPIARNL